MKKTLRLLCLVLALILMLAACDMSDKFDASDNSANTDNNTTSTDTTPNNTQTPSTGTTPNNTQTPSTGTTPASGILSTKNFSFTTGMMSYAIYKEYQELVAIYDTYSQQWGITISVPAGKGGTALDKTKALRKQYYATWDENGVELETPVTWFDHFAQMALVHAKEDLALCEAARADGVQLTDAELQSIEMQLSMLSTYALYYGYTTEEYITDLYGKGVTENDVRSVMKIKALASKYAHIKGEQLLDDVTDAQVSAEYDANRDKYDIFADYVGYTFTATLIYYTDPESAEQELENEASIAAYQAQQAAMEAYAAELAQIGQDSPAQFENKLFEILCLLYGEQAATEEMGNAFFYNVDTTSSSLDSTLKAWLTDQNREMGDVFTENNACDYEEENFSAIMPPVTALPSGGIQPNQSALSSTYTVYLLKSDPHRNTGTLRSAGHILFKTDTFLNLTDTETLSIQVKELAERVLSKYDVLTAEHMATELLALMLENGDLVQMTKDGTTCYAMDPAIFEAYGKQYTEDSYIFYENVYTGQMVENFENWLFDAERVPGEVSYPTVIETEYGYHIMIYLGNEEYAWSHTIRTALTEGKYDAWYEELLNATSYTEGAASMWNAIE